MSNLHPDRPPMVRVSAARPCPVCEKPDWCLVAPDASAAVCARVESGRRCGEAGWLHRMVGIRLRRPDGRKFAVRGGREGLFLPAANPDPAEPVLVTEGPTDAAAALTLGWVSVVGRPSCAGGTRLLVALLRSRRPPGVVIVADGDGPGRAGADLLGLDVAAPRRAKKNT